MTTSVNDPPRTPYQAQAQASCFLGQSPYTSACSAAFTDVPAGYRLFIRKLIWTTTVDNLPSAGQNVVVTLHSQFQAGEMTDNYVFLVPAVSSPGPVAGLSYLAIEKSPDLYFDAGNVFAFISIPNATASSVGTGSPLLLLGDLIDCTASSSATSGPCAAVIYR